ncbi:hypothetical protein RHSIM_Rhsim12G0015300 [Rhododendron simsii]|uniref:Uncharacterized protein n=1 Tax=Rhododendron simsii TaxID=118357 RepID=A0A834G561_RHOSS|nr:hypothetical protein RHSIM_Rhsim12G0015300 [Rhododendron simsii]
MTSGLVTNNSRVPTTAVLFVCMLGVAALPAAVVGECTCDSEEEDNNKSEALKYKLGAFFSILVAGAVGVYLPIVGKSVPALSPEKNAFLVVKTFAAGVILATGCVHVLPDAFDKLTSPCLEGKFWEFPWSGFVLMVAAIFTLTLDKLATSCYTQSQLAKSSAGPVNVDEEKTTGGEHANHGVPVHTHPTPDVPVHAHANHGHSHRSAMLSSGYGVPVSKELIRYRIIAQVLELGIVVHSVIIGLALGASESPSYIKPLVAALSFHQFFEGVGLGGCITQAKLKCRAVTIMAMFFSLTTPVGIAIGIGLTNVYKENSPAALIVEGMLNAASSGILIYMSLVDLLAADFENPRMQANMKLQMVAYVSLLFGAGCLSLLAKWA